MPYFSTDKLWAYLILETYLTLEILDQSEFSDLDGFIYGRA